MSLFKIERSVISDRREVIKKTSNGEIIYEVKYITEYNVAEHFLGILWNYRKEVKEQYSGVVFDSQELADLYVKNTYQCDEYYNNGNYYDRDNYRVIYPVKGEKFKNYGQFLIYLPGNEYKSIHQNIYFKFFDTDKFGDEKIRPDYKYCKLSPAFFKNIDDYIKQIETYINKLDNQPETVSAYDFTAMEVIPYDKLKASTEEIRQLNELLKQYREDQKAYTELLKKLMAK